MSAIAGVYLPKGPGRLPISDRLGRMLERQRHRGPDQSGVWEDGCVGLGQRMLWTTGESAGKKGPFRSQDSSLIAAVDVRLDNREELAEGCAIPRPQLASFSDEELVVAAYRRWGEASVEKLLGDFSFAIWDAREHRLFCARDPVGAKPFYYYRGPHLFAFASEIKALFALDGIPYEINEAWVGDFMAWNFEDKRITPYKGIERLEPATCLSLRNGSMRARRYWTLDPKRIRFKDDMECVEAFRELFGRAIRCRLRSRGTVGAHLTGGLDSSSIVCFAKEILGAPAAGKLECFSAIFPDFPPEDESASIRTVIDATGFSWNTVRGDRIGLFDDMDEAASVEEGPFLIPTTFDDPRKA